MQVLVGIAASEAPPVPVTVVKGISDRATAEAARRLVGRGAVSPAKSERSGEHDTERRAT